MQSLGRWIGSLASAGVVAGAYAVVGLLTLLDRPLALTGAIVATALVLAHVLLRPTRRGDVGGMAWLPGGLGSMVHQILGWPAWAVVAPLAVFAVVALLHEDQAASV